MSFFEVFDIFFNVGSINMYDMNGNVDGGGNVVV